MTSPELTFNTRANKLTAVRIAITPLVVLCLFEDSVRAGWAAAILFGIAGITDYFDGYYARTHKAVTVLGKLLDPLADKFLVVSSLIMLMHLGRLHPAVVIALICRELAITGLRAIASAEGIVIAASTLAKWKTVTQMAGIPLLMLHADFWGIPIHAIGKGLIWLSLLISVWSAKDYIVDFFRAVRDAAHKRREEKRARRFEKRADRFKKMLARNPELAEAVRRAVSDDQK